MFILDAHTPPSAGGYQIARSLRFNSADSAYLSFTPGTTGNRRTNTIFVWVKRNKLGVAQTLFSAGVGADDNTFLNLSFNASDQLQITGYTTTWRVTTQVFRDPTAWKLLCIAFDTTHATANSRIRFYENNPQSATGWQEITSFGTLNNPAQNTDLALMTNAVHNIGRRTAFNDAYCDVQFAKIDIVEGAQLDPSSATALNATTGALDPKQLVGGWGARGAELLFADNSNTTAATLGKDTGTIDGTHTAANNWTPNAISVTAGVGNDSLTDTPTNYGTDTGLGGEVRGNFATLNPLGIQNTSLTSLTNGLLDARNTNGDSGCFATQAVPSGALIYAEVTVTAFAAGAAHRNQVGVRTVPLTLTSPSGSGVFELRTNGNSVNTAGATYGGAITAGSSAVVMIAVNRTTGAIYFGYNGLWANGSGSFNLAWASASAAFTGMSTTNVMFFSLHGGETGNFDTSWNFGQRPFAYTAPSGYKALCTQNLADPAVPKPKSAFEAKLRTGTGAVASVTGLLFQPGLYIGKSRSAATDWAWYDSVRGVQKQVESNTTTAETTETTGLTAFNSDGISIGALAQINTNAATYLDLFFRFGATYGIEAVAYTGNGANRTIAHTLGKVPKMMIVFDLTTIGSHRVYHANMDASPQDGVMYLDTTAAYAAAATVWNSTAPTSSVFSVGTDARVNTNTSSYIAFLFTDIEGFSAFGSYTGNGSADGPYVHLGFRPGLFIPKNATSVDGWEVRDNLRDTYNPAAARLRMNMADAETTNTTLDRTALGVKIRSTGGEVNTSASRYPYMAFAQEAGKYSRAV